MKIKCPICENMIDKESIYCNFCATPVKDMKHESAQKEDKKVENPVKVKKEKHFPLLLVVGLCVCGIVAAILILMNTETKKISDNYAKLNGDYITSTLELQKYTIDIEDHISKHTIKINSAEIVKENSTSLTLELKGNSMVVEEYFPSLAGTKCRVNLKIYDKNGKKISENNIYVAYEGAFHSSIMIEKPSDYSGGIIVYPTTN